MVWPGSGQYCSAPFGSSLPNAGCFHLHGAGHNSQFKQVVGNHTARNWRCWVLNLVSLLTCSLESFLGATLFLFSNFVFCLGEWPVNNVIVSGRQQED